MQNVQFHCSTQSQLSALSVVLLPLPEIIYFFLISKLEQIDDELEEKEIELVKCSGEFFIISSSLMPRTNKLVCLSLTKLGPML